MRLVRTLPGTPTLAGPILAGVGRATGEEREYGARWYSRMARLVRRIADEVAFPPLYDYSVAYDVAAVLSPRVTVQQNLRLLCDALAGREVRHYSLLVGRALGRLSGDLPRNECVRGPKVRAYAHLLASPYCERGVVCVDTHAARLVCEPLGLDWERVLSWVGGYSAVASAYRYAARELGVLPQQAQAVSWLVERRERYGSVERF